MSDHDPQLQTVAALIGDASRATILLSLMGGRQLPASDLARRAHIAPATCSEHLTKLVAGGLVTGRAQGRSRYYRLASTEVAEVLEGLLQIAPPASVRSLQESTLTQQLHAARTCYDHLAGGLGIAVTEAMQQAQWLSADPDTGLLSITADGAQQFAQWGLVLAPRRARPLIRSCLDWSERQYHIAGQLGAAVAQWFFHEEWIERGGSGRIIRVTARGASALNEMLGLVWPPLPTQNHPTAPVLHDRNQGR